MNPEQNQASSQPINQNGATNPAQPVGSTEPAPQAAPQVVVGVLDSAANSPIPSSEPPVQGGTAMVSSGTPKKGFPKLLVALVIIIVIAAGVAAFFILSGKKNGNLTQGTNQDQTAAAVKISDKYLADLQSDNATNAYSLYSPNYQKASPESLFAQGFNVLSTGAKKAKFKLVYESFSRSSHPARVTTVYEVLPTGSGYFGFLLQNNGQWQIIGIQATNSLANAKQVSPLSSN